MKKEYMKPTIEVAKIKMQANMLQAVSQVTSFGLDDDLNISGGSGNPEEEGW